MRHLPLKYGKRNIDPFSIEKSLFDMDEKNLMHPYCPYHNLLYHLLITQSIMEVREMIAIFKNLKDNQQMT